jgi:hypothetical protein
MSFFSRPNLDNLQFKQTTDAVLGLSGQTQILTASGLTLYSGVGNIPINAVGAVVGNVMTFDGNVIRLMPSTSGGTGLYSGASPTTITVGGLISGSSITALPISDILERILVPTLYPTFVAPSSSFDVTPSTLVYEVGTSINLTGTSTFDRGTITPPYGTSGYRSGVATGYEYQVQGTPYTTLNPDYALASYTVVNGNNTFGNKVKYAQGEQPLNSTGGTFSTPLPSGSTSGSTFIFAGIYPYFYGKVASSGAPAGVNRPSATAALITGGTKVVASSDGTISIDFNSTNDEYIWFAIPAASTSKTKWYVDSLNNGDIGGSVSVGGNLFPNYNAVPSVTTIYWSGQSYKLYISNYQTELSEIIELRNS